jgi:hypothetical protein
MIGRQRMAGELIAANAQWLDGYAWRLPSV